MSDGNATGAIGGLRALVALALVVVAATIAFVLAAPGGGPAPRSASGLRASALPEGLDGAAAPRIRLRDARGRVIDTRSLRGRPYLVTFVYTRCRDVCPVIGADIAAALRRLGPRAKAVSALMVSVDPRGDTPVRARAWLVTHSLPAQAHYLLGASRALLPVWRDWFLMDGSQRRLDPITHAASVWLVDAHGRLRGRWSAGAPIEPDDIAHDLGALIGRT
jgi:protein SCO1/2